MEAPSIVTDEAKLIAPSDPEIPASETPEETRIEFRVGEVLNISGIRMRVVNIASQSIVLHPIDEPVYLVKGVPMTVKKMIGSNYVMRPLPADQVDKLYGGTH